MIRTSPYPGQALADVENASFVSFLDLSRWIAASIVFVGHLRNPMFFGYSSVPAGDRGVVVQLWYFVTGWHAEAVVVFFVLSGYLVGGLSSARLSMGRFSLANYSIDRVTRLFVAFLPALALTAALDIAGNYWFHGVGFWTHAHPMIKAKVATGAFETYATLSIFLKNALMMQTIWAPSFGSNQPLWTISLEFWFYVVFGLVLAAGLAGSFRLRLFGIAAAVGTAAVLGGPFSLFMGLWLLGVGAAFVPWRSVERPVAALALLGALLTLVRVFDNYFDHHEFARIAKEYAIAATFAWLCVSMRGVSFKPLEWAGGFNKFMADFSYSLYLIHFPTMLFILAALHATGRFPSIATGYSPGSAQGLLVYGAMIGLVYLSAWSFAQATERQTWKARRFLKGLIATKRSEEVSA